MIHWWASLCVLYCICTSNASYNGRNYLLVILLIEIDIRKRAEYALKEEVYSEDQGIAHGCWGVVAAPSCEYRWSNWRHNCINAVQRVEQQHNGLTAWSSQSSSCCCSCEESMHLVLRRRWCHIYFASTHFKYMRDMASYISDRRTIFIRHCSSVYGSKHVLNQTEGLWNDIWSRQPPRPCCDASYGRTANSYQRQFRLSIPEAIVAFCCGPHISLRWQPKIGKGWIQHKCYIWC